MLDEVDNKCRWAIAVDPENVDLQQRVQAVNKARANAIPTVPSLFGDELKTNPLLRPSSLAIRKSLGILDSASDEAAFTAIRAHKDTF